MIKKTIYPVGEMQDESGKRIMKVDKTISECRVFGILLYKKEVISPHQMGADYWECFFPNL